MSSVLSSLAAFLRGAIRRLPVEASAIAIATGASVAAIHADRPGVWHARLLLAGLLTMPLAFAARERSRHGAAVGALVGALVLACVSWALPDTAALQTPAVQWGLGLGALAAVLTPFCAAAPRFSAFVRRFFEELTTASLLGGAALVALLILGVALDELFEVNTKRVTADAMVLTAAAIALIATERLLPDRVVGGKVPEIWRRLAVAIGAPFVALMLGILVVYELGVLVRGELPKNLLSPLIIGAGAAGYGCTLIISAIVEAGADAGPLSPAEPHPFLRQRSVQLARAFPVVLLALLPMALVAVLMRIEQYGLTPFRVARLTALLCLTALGALGTWRWLRGRPALTWQVPALLTAFALAIAAGPCSAVRLSVRSQTARLDRLLTAAGITTPSQREVRLGRYGAAAELRPLPPAAWTELADTIQSVAELGGAPALRRVLGGRVEDCVPRYGGARNCLDGLGLINREHQQEPHRFFRAEAQAAVEVPAGQLTFFIATPGTQTYVSGQGLHLWLDEREAAPVKLEALVIAATEDRPLPPAPLPVRTAEGGDAGVVVLQRLDVALGEGGLEVTRAEGVWVRPAR